MEKRGRKHKADAGARGGGKNRRVRGRPGLTVVINGLTDAKNGIASLGDATLDQLEDLDLIVRVLKGMVVKYGQTLANKKFKTAAALGNATIAELDARREHARSRRWKKISDMLNEDMVNPMDWFTRMGGAAESVWKELQDGFNRRVWHAERRAGVYGKNAGRGESEGAAPMDRRQREGSGVPGIERRDATETGSGDGAVCAEPARTGQKTPVWRRHPCSWVCEGRTQNGAADENI